MAELLRSAKGGLELVDAREFLPLFRCRPGLSDWLVIDDFNAAKMEAKDKKMKAKRGGATATAESGSADEAVEVEEGAPVTEETMAEPATDEGKMEQAGGDAEASAATEGAAGSDFRRNRDFSHVTDPELRRCLEMGMQHYPDFASVPAHMDRKIRKSFFPPSEEEKQWMRLGEMPRLLRAFEIEWNTRMYLSPTPVAFLM